MPGQLLALHGSTVVALWDAGSGSLLWRVDFGLKLTNIKVNVDSMLDSFLPSGPWADVGQSLVLTDSATAGPVRPLQDGHDHRRLLHCGGG